MYAELHCHSNYSFQEGASSTGDLLVRAEELGYPALAITDHDNLCGVMEFAQAAAELDVRAVIGAEVTLEDGSQVLEAEPAPLEWVVGTTAEERARIEQLKCAAF